MRTIIAGSRGIVDIRYVQWAVHHSGIQISEVVHGGARGVDTLAGQWAAANNVPVKVFPADWNTHGKAAGFMRNQEMAAYAQALIAIWDGVSRGTQHMLQCAGNHKLRIHLYKVII